jgi:asparagine synthase (glutamine-hydrolysing)
MCGIAGILKLNGSSVDQDLLKGMIATLTHRGPDEKGVYVDARVGLAHARLSILDLEGGRQPMSTIDRSVWITFSGEIFNYRELREELTKKGHRFATRSDTEVILELYRQEGESCVQRLNGQWAFAIWDTRRQTLFLSRDRLGIRPLFYTVAGGGFIFASEIKAIVNCPEVRRELDLQALDQICTFWVTIPPRTIFKNIFQLEPGCSLTWQSGRTRVRRYWTLEYPPEKDLTLEAPKQKSEELLELMADATRVRLRADVAIGTYLSGGIDSTFITALAAQMVGPKLQSFSLAFADSEFDESFYQNEASAFVETQHTQLRCSCKQIGEVFPKVVWHAEQPILRTAPAPLYLLAKLVKESGLKVVLTGEGSDEVLGGYDIFKEAKIRRFWQQRPSSRMRPLLLKKLYPYISNIRKQPGAALESFFRVTPADQANPLFSHLPRWRLTSQLKVFFSEAVKSELADYDAYGELRQRLPDSFSNWHSFCQAQYLETAYLLPGYILSSQGDRMAMAHSIEARHPFLDHRVVEFGARLHPSLKMRALNEKYILKRASKGIVPPAIIARSKQPYRAPEGESFLTATSLPLVEEFLSATRIQQDGVFRSIGVSSLLSKFKSGRAIGVRDNMALNAILSTELLLQQFIRQKGEIDACPN